jgi:RNase adapter protein RapZ
MMPDKNADRNASTTASARSVLLLSGMSGAGLSTTLNILEDMGYEAVDNLRLDLIVPWVDGAPKDKALAVVIDARNASFSSEALLQIYARLQERKDSAPRLVFLDAADEKLQQRFSETRRRHPLALDRPVSDGIHKERALLACLRDVADQVIDTSALSIHDLKRHITGAYALGKPQGISLYVMSFSYRQGIPREADLVFDVRFLSNPYWDRKLRPLTGFSPDVAAYIQKDGDYESFMNHLTGLLLPLLPRYQLEGKSYLTIAVGCTGGRHRSVFIAEQLATTLTQQGYTVGTGHRDIERSNNKK